MREKCARLGPPDESLTLTQPARVLLAVGNANVTTMARRGITIRGRRANHAAATNHKANPARLYVHHRRRERRTTTSAVTLSPTPISAHERPTPARHSEGALPSFNDQTTRGGALAIQHVPETVRS